MNKLLTALIFVATAATAQAAVYDKSEKQMSFETCVAKTQQMMNVVPSKVVVSTDIITTVRFKTAEGSLLATCSKPDQKMSLIYTTNPF